MQELLVTVNKVYPPKGKAPATIYPADRDQPKMKVFPSLWDKKGAIHQGQTITMKGTTQFSDYSKENEFIAKDYEFSGEPGASGGGHKAAPAPLLTRDQGMAAMGFAHRQATPDSDPGTLAALYATGYEAWLLFEEYLKSSKDVVKHPEPGTNKDGLPKDEIPF
jgi:hypothetical protein